MKEARNPWGRCWRYSIFAGCADTTPSRYRESDRRNRCNFPVWCRHSAAFSGNEGLLCFCFVSELPCLLKSCSDCPLVNRRPPSIAISWLAIPNAEIFLSSLMKSTGKGGSNAAPRSTPGFQRKAGRKRGVCPFVLTRKSNTSR